VRMEVTSDISKMTRVIQVNTKRDETQLELDLRRKDMAPVRPEGPYPKFTPEEEGQIEEMLSFGPVGKPRRKRRIFNFFANIGERIIDRMIEFFNWKK